MARSSENYCRLNRSKVLMNIHRLDCKPQVVAGEPRQRPSRKQYRKPRQEIGEEEKVTLGLGR
ncbi:hypothetical protein ACLOJK_013983 [Asimina triloba]